MTSLQEIYTEEIKDCLPSQALLIKEARGSYLFDLEEKRYLDFSSGDCLLGHAHPEIIRAITEQARKLTNLDSLLWTQEKIDLIKNFREISGNLDFVTFRNSERDAVESAFCLIQKAQKARNSLICFKENYYGNSSWGLSISAIGSKNKENFAFSSPFSNRSFFLDFPSIFSKSFRESRYFQQSSDLKSRTKVQRELNLESLNQLKKIFEEQAPPETVSAIILETIASENGCLCLNKEFLQALRKICTENSILLIFLERESTFGRAGSWFDYQNYQVQPDLLIFSRSISNGLPIAGFSFSKEKKILFEAFKEFNLSSLFSSYPLNSIAVSATLLSLKTIKAENLIEKVNKTSLQIINKFAKKFGDLLEIRGKGLLLGIKSKKDLKLNTKSLINRAKEKGLLVKSCMFDSETIKITPPLNIDSSSLQEGLNTLEQILDYEILISQESKKFY